jgi:hypothetical protein
VRNGAPQAMNNRTASFHAAGQEVMVGFDQAFSGLGFV